MIQAEYTASPPDRNTANSGVATEPHHYGWLNWIAHFTVYLGVVALVCALGIYSLWHLPLPQDWAQFFNNEGHIPAKPGVDSTANAPAKLLLSPQVQPSADAAAPETVATATSQPTPNAADTADDEVVVAAEAQPAADTPQAAADTPPAAPETLAPAPQTEIEQLLAEAQQQMDSRRLTAPAQGNALNSYRRILDLDPNNAAAKAGIERIAAYYREVAENSLRQGRPDESVAYIQRGLRAAPQSQELANLRSQALLLQQQREQAQRQTQREEQRRREAEQALAEQQYQEELRRQQLQMRQQRQAPPASKPWWQAPPTYNQGSGFQSK